MKKLLSLATTATVVLMACIGVKAEPLPRPWVAGNDRSCNAYAEHIYNTRTDIAQSDAWDSCMRGEAASPASAVNPRPPVARRPAAPDPCPSGITRENVCACAARYAASLGSPPDPRPCTWNLPAPYRAWAEWGLHYRDMQARRAAYQVYSGLSCAVGAAARGTETGGSSARPFFTDRYSNSAAGQSDGRRMPQVPQPLLAKPMQTRRDVALGGLLTIVFGFGAGCPCHAQGLSSRSTAGCLIGDDELPRVYPIGTPTTKYVHGSEPIIYSSGDRDLDRALAQTLAKCGDLFGVVPGFAFFDDSASPNAYATDQVRMQRADGTVLMGKQMLRRLLNLKEAPDAALASVCAHEFGHILQFKRQLVPRVMAGQNTVKPLELQADLFAGYFAGMRKRERPAYPAAVFAVTTHLVGDMDFTDRNHHGTPDERAAALVRGFEAAFRERLDVEAMIEMSLHYVAER